MVYRCQSVSLSALVLLALCGCFSTTNSFHSPCILRSGRSTIPQCRDEMDTTTASILLVRQPHKQPHHNPPKSTSTTSTTTRLFMAKMWERLQIEEDEEPMWYLLNCVAGLEMDLLRQCRQRCEGMEDVVKFVLPMTQKIRSHGANRMVTETKTQYQGYVFAKLRLCAETYHAVQGTKKATRTQKKRSKKTVPCRV
jgi:hypothetical protein